ncbi:MAG TPA: hypothetical protein VJ878_04750 [Candidatus Izemoplasmatales bacterium]|nr:hypothetical protein [Candidatus Izemoplasmatales bacterium]
MNNKEKIKEVIRHCKSLESPKISLVMPTHRTSPENRKDKILFKNLLQDIKVALENEYDRTSYEKSLDRLNQLLEDTMFWMHTNKGLLVVACDEYFETFKLQDQVKEKISVSDAFHVQPIFKHYEIYGKNYLIDLAKDRFKMYRLQQEGIQEMTNLEIKTSFTELYDDFDQDANLNVASYGGLSGMYHGHREKSNETQKDREKYFRYLDKEFKQLHQEEDSQFIFSGTRDNIAMFKKISDENFYHELTINKPLASMKHNEIQNKIGDILKPLIDEALENIKKDIRNAEQDNKCIKDFVDIKEAVEQGRVDSMILKDKPTMAVNIPLDGMVNRVIDYGGDVIVLSPEELKDYGDYIAILR